MNNISFKQYRAIDLGIWTLIAVVIEGLTVTAAVKWFPGELYSLSQTLVVICLVMMRWGGWAAVHAVAGGIAFSVASGATASQFVVYCIGNCFALCGVFFLKKFGKEAVRGRAYLTVLYVLTAFVGMQIGRWLVSMLFGARPASIVEFFTTDSLTLVYTVIVILISRKADGVFEDQKSYLIRTEAERRRRSTLD